MDDVKLAEIESLAEVQFSVQEVAIITELSVEQVSDGPGAVAYARGKLKAEAEVRRAILTLAKQGSTPAQKQFMDLARQTELRLNDVEDSDTDTEATP